GPGNAMDSAYHPSDANVIYAATQVGGVWKSVDAGLNFLPQNNGLPAPWATGSCVCQDIRQIVVDQTTPSTVYAGSHLMGVFRTLDGGENWEGIAPELAGATINCLVQEPNGALLACAAGQGVWRSTDGNSFSKLTTN